MDNNLINRIISAAYGDCSFSERRRIMKIIKADPEAKRLYNSYRQTALKAHSLGNVECPDYIVKKAGEKINPVDFRGTSFLRSAGAFAVIIIAVIVALFTLTEKHEYKYTTAEIRTAEAQATESLAYIGSILNKTTSTLSTEIIPDKVSKPIKKGINIINNLLIGG